MFLINREFQLEKERTCSVPLSVWLGFWERSHTTQLWAWSLMERCIVYVVWFLPLCPSLIFFNNWPISIIYDSFRAIYFLKLFAQGREKDFSCLPEGKKSAVALMTAGQAGDTCFPELWHGLSFGYQADQKRGKMREGVPWWCKCGFAMRSYRRREKGAADIMEKLRYSQRAEDTSVGWHWSCINLEFPNACVLNCQ